MRYLRDVLVLLGAASILAACWLSLPVCLLFNGAAVIAIAVSCHNSAKKKRRPHAY